MTVEIPEIRRKERPDQSERRSASRLPLCGYGVQGLVEGAYHLDSMAASETVKLADRILTDYRSELRHEAAMADMVQLLDMFAKVGWPDALALLWRLDEVFR